MDSDTVYDLLYSTPDYSSASVPQVASNGIYTLLATPTNNMKGIILEDGGTVSNVYIATIINGVVYYLTTMPNVSQSAQATTKMGLALLPVKITNSMSVADIADENVVGSLYNIAGTMSQTFAIKSSATTYGDFRIGYASNLQMSRTNSFSMGTQMVPIARSTGGGMVQTPIPSFRNSGPARQGRFIMSDNYNLSLGSLFAGVNYRLTFDGGDIDYIPFYLLKSPSKINTQLSFPNNFVPSSGFIVNVTNSTLFGRGNCSTMIAQDPRDILASNMLGTLTDTIFTNSNDCIVGVNYAYCTTAVTCAGDCYSQCPTGSCQFNAGTNTFGCSIPLSPIEPEFAALIAPIAPASALMFWIILAAIVIFIILIIAAVVYFATRSNTTTVKEETKVVEGPK